MRVVWLDRDDVGVSIVRCGQARKRDKNEAAIVDALERVGAAVFRLSGAGVPDLLVAYRGRWTPLEVKANRGTLTPRQVAVYVQLGANPIPVARTAAEALAVIGATR